MSLGPDDKALQQTGEEDGDPAILGGEGSADYDDFDHDSYEYYVDGHEE